MSQLAILTGAGASYGSGVRNPPPLGDALYSALRAEFPDTWGGLRGGLHQLFTGPQGFESGMYEMWRSQRRRSRPNPSPFLIDLARFFLKYEPPGDGSDCYSELLRTLVVRRLLRRTGFATLNYECLLDLAANDLGLLLAHLNDGPVPRGNVQLWKPHGACNLLPTGGVYGIELDHMPGAAGAYYEGDLRVLSPEEVRREYDRGFSFPPAMSLFAPGKPTPVAREFIGRTRLEWARWVSTSTLIITIGARPNLADTHVWNPIVDSAAPIWYIGGLDSGFEDLRTRVSGRVDLISQRFDEGVELIKTRLLRDLSPPTS